MSTDKPNLLLITTDTSRCDTLRCMGSDFAISPNLDRLASEGVMFMNAHTSSPVCSPARCSLLTGLHTPVHGCIENGVGQRGDQVTLPDLLKDAGYRNIMIGKTHFGEIPQSFDVVTGRQEHRAWLENQDVPEDPDARPARLHGDSFFVDQTIEELRQAAGDDEPFFAFCSLNSPHPPARPPVEFADRFDEVALPELNYVEGEEQRLPEHEKMLLGIEAENRLTEGESKQDPHYWREAIGRIIEQEHLDTIDRMRRLYYSYAAFSDSLVGRLVDFLDEAGLSENTLVIFSSDHGQQNFDHGFNDKHNYYDESWRIPFIMRMPGTLPAGEQRQFAIWNDITTTLLAAAGVDCPTMQGFDLWTPLCAGEEAPRGCAVGTVYKSCAVATERWKLEYYMEDGIGRLFDRVEDPQERNDLFDSSEHHELRNEMLEALLAWRSDICDLQRMQKWTMENTSPNAKGYRNVAPRAAEHVWNMRGTDAEVRLARRVQAAETRFHEQQYRVH